MITKLRMKATCIAVGLLATLLISCSGQSGESTPISDDGEAALAEINKQNAEKYVLIKTTLQELAELSGPIAKKEGEHMTQSKELHKRIQMIKERIATLEEMATDSTDNMAVKSLTALLKEKETTIRQLKKTVSEQGSVIRQQGEDLQNAYERLEMQYNELRSKNQQLENRRQQQASILYTVATDYMKMGEFNFYKMEKSSSRLLQWTCFNNAYVRFMDAQKFSGHDYSDEIQNALTKRDAIKK